MSLTIQTLNKDTLEMEINGTLEKKDYESFVPIAENAIEKQGKISMLLRIHDFSGWRPAALWEDLKFDIKHYSDVDKLALVADDDSKSWLATISKPFTGAEVKFFTKEQIEDARAWVS